MGRYISNSHLASLWIGITGLLMLLAVIQNREFAGALESSEIALTVPVAVEMAQGWSARMDEFGVNQGVDELRYGLKNALGMEL